MYHTDNLSGIIFTVRYPHIRCSCTDFNKSVFHIFPFPVLFAPRGENGFGYDPLFLPDGYDCSMAELRPEEKNAISHRGNALKILKEELRNYYADK